MSEERKARLAKFILGRLLELASGMKLMWIDMDSGVAQFQFAPNDEQVKALVADFGGVK